MALYKKDDSLQRLFLIEPCSLKKQGILEKQHLQPLLCRSAYAIDPEIRIISEEFSRWEDSKRRIDLLGIDKDANLVIIELKRDEDEAHMELQAIRYAAMISAMSFKDVVATYEDFLKNHNESAAAPESAREELVTFLEHDSIEDPIISSTPRIILVNADFSIEITSTVLWLNEQGLDITCVKANYYTLNGEEYFDIDPIIPLPSANDYQVKIREKTKAIINEQMDLGKKERALQVLFSKGYLSQGTKLHLLVPPRATIPETADEKIRKAIFNDTSSKGIVWAYDENKYSLSSLCKVICNKYNGDVGAGFSGPAFWAKDGEDISLADAANTYRSL
jgi:hypothetical protein